MAEYSERFDEALGTPARTTAATCAKDPGVPYIGHLLGVAPS